MAEDLAFDLEELRHLQTLAKRPRVVSLLSSEILSLEKMAKKVDTTPAPDVPTSTLLSTPMPPNVSSSPALIYTTLGSFSWDQDNDKVKIYISLEGISEEKVEAEFKHKSLDIKFHGVQGNNYRYAVPKLNKEIVPESCKVTVKPTRVIVTLVKASKGNWPDLHFKEDKLKPSFDEDKDPMAGIMNLMKNMYEEGDEDMKRTIAKAWTDSRSGKGADPVKGFQ